MFVSCAYDFPTKIDAGKEERWGLPAQLRRKQRKQSVLPGHASPADLPSHEPPIKPTSTYLAFSCSLAELGWIDVMTRLVARCAW